MSRESVQQRLQQALHLHEAGQLPRAEQIYRAVLADDPSNADALHLLGVLCLDTGRAPEGIALLSQAASQAPASEAIQLNLGLAYRAKGDVSAAIGAWRRAIQLNPNFVEARANLAAALTELGRLDEAESAWRDAIRSAPAWAEGYLRLGELLVVRDDGRTGEAEQSFRAAQAIEPHAAPVAMALGALLARQHRFTDALAQFQLAERSMPDNAFVLVNTGQALCQCDRAIDAERMFLRAITIDPNLASAHHGLAVALKPLGKPAGAEAAERRAIELDPNWADPQHGLGNVLHELGRVDEAIAAYRRCIELNPSHVAAHSSLLVVLNYTTGHDAPAMFAEHRRWTAVHADPLTPAFISHESNRDPDRRLSIAYVSPDLRRHAVSHFFEPLLAGHDRSRFHITCYASVVREDEVSAPLKAMCDRWLNVANMDDASLARTMAADQIDIAIDLAGHTAGNRLLAFARRPAPVQVSYLGYPNTTGMRSIDYVITDVVQDPPGTERFHSERLIRLPRTMHAYVPPADCPDIGNASTTRPIRFGSFNRLEKISPQCVELWAGAMRAVAEATLVLKSPGLADPNVRADVLSRFARHGVIADRLELVPRDATFREHYERYALIDVALDTFPYNGTTTTCEALWMGVPVITLEGPTRVTRTTAGILRAIGLADCVAHNAAEFAAIATRFSRDREALASLRSTMRERMRSSPLMDGVSLAAAIEREYRRIWQEWCVRT